MFILRKTNYCLKVIIKHYVTIGMYWFLTEKNDFSLTLLQR